MVRVELVGPHERLAQALAFLQAHAAVELRRPDAPARPTSRAATRAVPGDGTGVAAEEEARLRDEIERLDALLAALPPAPAAPRRPAAPPGPGASLGAVAGAPAAPLPEPGSEGLAARLAALQAELAVLEGRRRALEEEQATTARFGRLVVALAPLGHALNPACQPELHALVLRGDPATVALLEGEVRRLTDGAFELKARPLDRGTTGVLLAVPRPAGHAVTSLLSERGVPELPLPDRYAGKRLVDVLLLLAARERALPAELAEATAARTAFASAWRGPLEAARRAAAWSLERQRAAGALGGLLPHAGLAPLLVTAATLGALALLLEGPLAALDVVLALGNVLSYARLMALGLASVMLAEVANRVATTLEPAAAGLSLAVLLHAVNFTLGLISPTVAALRLQYVEFFDKFDDEGGFPFRPFGLGAAIQQGAGSKGTTLGLDSRLGRS